MPTMPDQKIFKQRVRTRMAKTGEAYTAARHQLLQKADEPVDAQVDAPVLPDAPGTPVEEPATATAQAELMTSDESMRRATGRGHDDWFGLLDEWGATEQRHTAIATWLRETQGVPGWWAQNITVSYERVRGMRAPHQVSGGFSISVTRTIGAEPDRLLEAFTNDTIRARWLADAPMTARPTRAHLTARYDWTEPPSRVVVTVLPKADKAVVNVTHEQLPDAVAADRMKASWREWLGRLKSTVERD
jgi:hypothetical protein